MMIGRTLRRVYSRTPVMTVLPWRTTERTERDAQGDLIDCAPPPAAADIVVQRIEDTLPAANA